MLAPITWLKEYTEINSNLEELMWKMTEVGLTTETCFDIEEEKVLDIEVTPNRPDWLSIVGIAREISVIEDSELKLPVFNDIPKPTKNLPIKVSIDPKLVGRYSGITIQGVKVKPSPEFMQKRLKLIGLRPINNLVDITNYVMFELGLPIHVFDYDKFLTDKLSIELTKGGEDFISVDGISYKLPKNSLIIKDKDRVIDLCGIKGGENTGISEQTKNIFIHVPIYSPVLIRKTSQSLKLSSEASYIYERGPDLGGTINSLKRSVELILRYAGGEISSKVIDLKQKEYNPKQMVVYYNEVVENLGIDIDKVYIKKILNRLGLSPSIKDSKIELLIPTYRNDLNIKEDIYEEVARIYGYNKFPKTLPYGKVLTTKIPYFYDRNFELLLKSILVSCGFFEVNTLALTSKEKVEKSNLNLENHIKIANPVSKEFEYLRTSLVPDLVLAINLNSLSKKVSLFEYNKTYFGPIGNSQEIYKISAIEKGGSYESIKGVVETILDKLNIFDFDLKPYTLSNGFWHPVKAAVIEKKDVQIGVVGEIHPKVLKNFETKEILHAFEIEVKVLNKLAGQCLFKDLSKYPPQIEDLSLKIPTQTEIGKVMKIILNSDRHVSNIEFIDRFKNIYTFRLYYQHSKKTLNNKEVLRIRNLILNTLKQKFKITSSK